MNAFQMQQMHQGQLPAPSTSLDTPYNHQLGASQQLGRALGNPPNGKPAGSVGTTYVAQPNGSLDSINPMTANATSLDDLLLGAAKEVDQAQATASSMLGAKTDDPPEEKKGKKEKDKNTKLVYSDNDVSPEEKMAQLPRYAFAPGGKEGSALGDATTAAVTGSSS